MRIKELVLKRRGHRFFCTWPYWICICRSFPFRRKIYGRRVFKWITQRGLLTFALVKLLAQIKYVLNYFALEITVIIVARRRHAENRERVVERRGFFPRTFRKQEEHIVQTYRLPSHVIFNLLQEIKDNLEPPTGSHAIPALSKLLANLHFLVLRFFSKCCDFFISLFFICDYANLCCAW